MNIRFLLPAVFGLALALPSVALAQSASAPAPSSLAAATNAYFAAFATADYAALARTTTRTFRMIGPDGKAVDPGEYLGAMYTRHIDSSTPRTTVQTGTPVVTGKTATEPVFYASFDYRILDGFQFLERDNSDHQLSFVQAADGTWLLDEDHITGARHFE